MVIVTDIFVGEVIDYIDRADRHTICVFVAQIYSGKQVGIDAQHTTVTATPLFTDHSTFFVYLVIFEQNVVGPVVQNQQTRVQYTGTVYRGIADIIDGFVYAGIGI